LDLLLFLPKNTAVSLSHKILSASVTIEFKTLVYTNKFLIHKPSHTASYMAINSAYMVEMEINDRFIVFHATAPPTSMNTYPDVDFFESG